MAAINKPYAKITLDDIMKWCEENNQKEWLKEKAKEVVDFKIYPTITITKVNEETGEEIVKTKVDKKGTPTIEKRPITFMQMKLAFCKQFMPEVVPTSNKKKKESMFDKIANW